MTHPLRSYRQSAGLSVGQLAASAGLNKSTVSRIETGAQSPSFDAMRRLIAATNGAVSASDFFPQPTESAPASTDGAAA